MDWLTSFSSYMLHAGHSFPGHVDGNLTGIPRSMMPFWWGRSSKPHPPHRSRVLWHHHSAARGAAPHNTSLSGHAVQHPVNSCQGGGIERTRWRRA